MRAKGSIPGGAGETICENRSQILPKNLPRRRPGDGLHEENPFNPLVEYHLRAGKGVTWLETQTRGGGGDLAMRRPAE